MIRQRLPFCAALLAALIPWLFHAGTPQAQAQTPPSPPALLAPGFAIVSGFSGATLTPSPLPPGVNPVDKLAIHRDGISLRTIDLSRVGGPPDAQTVPARKSLAIPASRIGQVFAVTLDDAVPPNIYAAATSAYGLPIVTPDSDGDGVPERALRGAANADFMPGLFGPVQAGGGPGSIWKIDGLTGQVMLFANVQLDGMPNTGAALGGLVYDPGSRQFYVADRGSGVIHSFNLDGIETGRFDHGVQGRNAARMPPVAFDPNRRTSIRSPQFDSTVPDSWGYAPAVRRVFGLAVHRGRLYYAVASGLQIWSVSLAPNGAFGPDARIEVTVPPGVAPTSEISKILFDDNGDMLLAERGAPAGAYDFGALRQHDTGRVLRFRPKPPGAGGTPFYWEPAGDYAIGFPPNFQNGDGGIALGYGYEPDGYVNLGACGGTLWSTGSQLRMTPNPALAQRLATGGPLPIDGLQGHAVPLMRPLNTPPLSSYFIDADDIATRADTLGHMGDVVTWRACPGIAWLDPMYVEMLVVELWCPPGTIRGRDACIPTPCPPGQFFFRGRCADPVCPPELRTPIRGLCCPAGSKWDNNTRKCSPSEVCPIERQTRDGKCCPAGQTVNSDGNCQPPPPPPVCPIERMLPDDRCCPVGQVPISSRECGPPPPPACPPERQARNGQCCPAGQIANRDGTCRPSQRECRIGESVRELCVCSPPSRIVNGRCTPPRECNVRELVKGQCECSPPSKIINGRCTPPRECRGGEVMKGQCVCSPPSTIVNGRCTPPPPETVPPPAETFCHANQSCMWKPAGGTCPRLFQERDPILPGMPPMCCNATPGNSCTSCVPNPGEITRSSACGIRYPNNPAYWPCVSGLADQNMCLHNSDCAPGSVCSSAGRCVVGEYCPSSSAAPASIPAPPPTSGPCPPATIRVGGSCCTPEAVAAGLCGGTPPPGKPVCTGGKKLFDNVCKCDETTIEDKSGQCVTPPPAGPNVGKKKDPVCKKGTRLVGGRCVPIVRRQPDPPPQQPQAVPQIGIGIGIGIGGGGRGGRPGVGRPGTPPPPPPRLAPN
jgi:hypothetical protein